MQPAGGVVGESNGYTKIKSFVHIENVASNKIFMKNGAKLLGVFHDSKNIYETTIE